VQRSIKYRYENIDVEPAVKGALSDQG